MLTFFAAVALVVGILLPFVSIHNEIAGHKTYSMLGGILELFQRGNLLIGAILLVFYRSSRQSFRNTAPRFAPVGRFFALAQSNDLTRRQ